MPAKRDLLYQSYDKLKHLQDKKLHYFVTRHLYPFSPYYRRLFDKNKINPDKIRTVEDLKRIPFTSKEDFFSSPGGTSVGKTLEFVLRPEEELFDKYLPRHAFLKLFLTRLAKGKKYLEDSFEEEYRPIFLTATAGTTNQPVTFLYTKYDIENLKICGRRIIEILDISRRERVLNCFPYAPHLAFWQTVFAGFSAGIFILSTGGGKTLGTEGNIRVLLKMKPKFLIGTPDYIYHLIKTASDENLNLGFVEGIVLGASRVPKGFKKKISRLLESRGSGRIRVAGTYGFTEARSAWTECPTDDLEISSGYHIYPDREVFEVIDPETGEVKGEGEDGELVYSALDGRASCVIRYRTGDIVRGGIRYGSCPHCGRTIPRISSDITRGSNVKDIQFSKIKGAAVNLNDLAHVLDDREEIGEWQIEIRKKNNDPYEVDEIALYACLLRDVNKEAFIKELNQKIFLELEISFNEITFLPRKDVLYRIEVETAIKAKRIVDKRIV